MERINDYDLELVFGGGDPRLSKAMNITAIASLPTSFVLFASSGVCQYIAKVRRKQGSAAKAAVLEKTSRVLTDVGAGVAALGTGAIIVGYKSH